MNLLFRFLLGTTGFSFPAEKKIDVLNHLLSLGIGALSCKTRGDECYLVVFRRDADKIPEELCTRVADFGFLSLIDALWHRPGLALGAALGIFLLVLASVTVWRVEIKGNEIIGAVEIEQALASAGLSVGDTAPLIDLDAVKTRFLQENPEVSWIGIYIRGTTAAVEVREAHHIDRGETVSGLCNLVAAADGVIERVSVDAGRAVVASGMTVRAGDLLISGIYRTATGLRTTRAEGRVLARSMTSVSVLQGFTYEEKEYGREETGEVLLEFFGKKIKLFKKSGKNATEYDIIKRKEQIVLFGRITLPIYIERLGRMPYERTTVMLNEEEAVRMAFSRLRAEMAARFANAEIVAEEVYGEWTDAGYALTARVEYVADIATPLAYDVDLNGG